MFEVEVSDAQWSQIDQCLTALMDPTHDHWRAWRSGSRDHKDSFDIGPAPTQVLDGAVIV